MALELNRVEPEFGSEVFVTDSNSQNEGELLSNVDSADMEDRGETHEYRTTA